MSLTGSLRRWAARTPPTRGAVRLLEALTSWLVVVRAGGFDAAWYAAQRGARPRGPAVLWAAHYVWRGRRAGLSPHPLFEPSFAFPADWRTSGPDPLARHLRGRPRYPVAPHPFVDPGRWLRDHPEAAGHRYGWFGHLLATAGPATTLPLPDWARRPEPLTVAAARQVALAQQRGFAAGEALRRAPRVTRAPLPAAAVARPAPTAALVSVVLPVRDRADVVGAAVASVLQQTHTELELLVVDDGSVDGTRAAVADAAAGDPRVAVLAGPARGVSAARNAGAARARGAYVAWLDSDNTWTPGHLAQVVGALEASGRRAGYDVVEGHGHGTAPRFRAFDPAAGLAGQAALDAWETHLAIANVVDLNVLVVRRDLLAEAGGFDETLRRTVDHDLVWRLARIEAPLFVPAVGVVYTEAERADRITVTEPAAWREVVKNRRDDWAARAAASRDDDLLSVLVASASAGAPGGSPWRGAWASVLSVLERPPPRRVEVVVTDDQTPRGSAAVLAALGVLHPGVTVRREPVRVGRALATNRAVAASRGSRVALLAEGALLWPGWAAAAEALDRPAVVAATVPQVDLTGVLAGAGAVATGGHPLPAPLLAGLPLADAVRAVQGTAAGRLLVDGPGEAFAVLRATDLVTARGLDPLAEGAEVTDLVLRLSAAGAGTGAPPVAVVAAGPVQRDPAVWPDRTRRLLAERHDLSARPFDPDPWAAAGFEVTGWSPDPAAGQVPAATLARRPRTATLGDGRAVPVLRWSVSTSAPDDPTALRWGDHHFAQALAAALERHGQHAAVDHRGAWARDSARFDDVVVLLRGLRPLPPRPPADGRTRLLWVISHPEAVDAAEVAGHDAAFAASLSWGAGLTDAHGRPVRALLQATDPARFHPPSTPAERAAAATVAGDAVFVGNSRGVYRPLVRTLVEAGVDVAVYGQRWAEFLGAAAARLVRAAHVPNERVAPLYAGARVVLNDHWDDMRAQGFVSNRLFDAAACGARVLSDDIPGAADLFGGLVRTYGTAEELLALVGEAPAGWPGDARRAELAARVAAEHSFDARADALLRAVLDLGGDLSRGT